MSSFSCPRQRRAARAFPLFAFALGLGSCSSSTEEFLLSEDSDVVADTAQSAAGQLQGQSTDSSATEDNPEQQDGAGTADPAAGNENLPDNDVLPDGETSEQEASEQVSDSADPLADTPYVVFEDPQTGFRTADFYDADRQLYHFHLADETLVRDDGNIPQRNWVTSGNELGPNGVFGSYRIRFGTEGGEARAYFTEVTPPTICNLVLEQPNGLSIFRGTETPPMN